MESETNERERERERDGGMGGRQDEREGRQRGVLVFCVPSGIAVGPPCWREGRVKDASTIILSHCTSPTSHYAERRARHAQSEPEQPAMGEEKTGTKGSTHSTVRSSRLPTADRQTDSRYSGVVTIRPFTVQCVCV